ncbi:MAG TPA: hypothetical protein VH257_00680, partial [Chloroflexota bacterium]|nr:hypothetical protein [Chloroflexota bacterium]
CALEGIATGAERPHVGIVTQKMKVTRYVAGAFIHAEPTAPEPVWCPTTAFGTWVMRQNGRVMITGNTKAKRRVTLSICGLGWLDESEVDSVPVARPVRVSVNGGIEDAAYLQKLRRRWAQVCAEADALGVSYEPLPEGADEATIVDRGRALKAAIAGAREREAARRPRPVR